jgi:hypothetical protein
VPSIAIHQLTRWKIGICPLTLGLSPAFNDFVLARIDAVADAVGAPHQSAAQCKHNVLIRLGTTARARTKQYSK